MRHELTVRDLMLWTLWLSTIASVAYAAESNVRWPLPFALFMLALAGVVHWGGRRAG